MRNKKDKPTTKTALHKSHARQDVATPPVEKTKTKTPDQRHDPDQAWYWTPEWQAAEKEADENLKSGRVQRFDTPDDLLSSLRKRKKKDEV